MKVASKTQSHAKFEDFRAFLPNSISALEGCRDFVLGAKIGSISKSQWNSTHILKISAKTDEKCRSLRDLNEITFVFLAN